MFTMATIKYDLSDRLMIVIKAETVAKSSSYPLGQRFAVMGLVFEGSFREVIRVDNFEHMGGSGTHIHYLDKSRVVWVDDVLIPFRASEIVYDYLIDKYPHLLENENFDG